MGIVITDDEKMVVGRLVTPPGIACCCTNTGITTLQRHFNFLFEIAGLNLANMRGCPKISGIRWLLWLGTSLLTIQVQGQNKLSGTVIDGLSRQSLSGVSVLNKHTARGTLTDVQGKFSIDAFTSDTIELSLLGYERVQLLAPAIALPFTVSMFRVSFSLPEVVIHRKDYSRDSLTLREQYADVFGYHKPGAWDVLKTLSVHPITAISYLIPSKARKRRESFHRQLLYWEKERFIDSRFSPDVVYRMTGLYGAVLDSFMLRYRPAYDFLRVATNYDLLEYKQQQAVSKEKK